jgi:ABC-type nitrate/sulfonate/bicarbonate transport system substrate-binding protein
VRALLGGRVDAATAFWNVEGVALRRRTGGSRRFTEFRVDDYGAPAYPELVLCVSRVTLQDDPDVVRAAIRALQRGYGETQQDPESAVTAMLEREPGLDRASLAAQLDAVAPAFQAGASSFGALDRERLEAWSSWDVEFGILKRPVDIGEAFDLGLVGAAVNP